MASTNAWGETPHQPPSGLVSYTKWDWSKFIGALGLVSIALIPIEAVSLWARREFTHR